MRWRSSLPTLSTPCGSRAGLAASQIGSSLAAFSYNVDGQFGYLINPRIVEATGMYDALEACLSIPGVSADRTRCWHAVAEGVDLEQRPVTVTGTGELARCLQHETDHTHGELYIDKLTGAERRRVMREIRQHQAAAWR